LGQADTEHKFECLITMEGKLEFMTTIHLYVGLYVKWPSCTCKGNSRTVSNTGVIKT